MTVVSNRVKVLFIFNHFPKDIIYIYTLNIYFCTIMTVLCVLFYSMEKWWAQDRENNKRITTNFPCDSRMNTEHMIESFHSQVSSETLDLFL